MAVQDKNGGTCSNLIDMASNLICLDDGKQPMEIYSSGDEHVLKVRKPYTITKQRERWTEEEHKKFLEALTLYGRAWRRIEEHIGTKTAVQIRSHAQKFFSKVVRESNGKTTGSVKPIEIPPPRPKRKPSHPYPRKQIHSFKKEVSVQEQPERSPSPNFSISEHENQSPKSVLSALGSETIGSTVSNLQNSSPSPVSSGADTNHDPHDESSMKFASCLKDDACIKEGLTRDAPLMSLKLFGRTVIVTDSHRPSESTIENSKASPFETHQEKQNPKQKDNPWPCEVPPAFHYMQLQKESPKPLEDASTSPVPWWALYGGFQFNFLPLSEQKSPGFCMKIESEEKECHKEGSQTDSSEAKIGEKSEDVVNSQRQEPSSYKEKEMGSIFRLRSSDTSADKCMKGFVPYKRCMAERDIQSSGISGEEREDQRIRLCL